MSIDPRLAARRRDVTEGAARRSLVAFVKWLGVGALLVAAGWFVQSPTFQLETLTIFGVTNSSAHRVLAEADVVVGRPLVFIRGSQVEQALRQDPWIADATVGIVFPDTVEVAVIERSAIAWVQSESVLLLVAADGTVLPSAGFDAGVPTARLDGLEPVEPGGVLDDERARGAVVFFTALDPAIAARGALSEHEGELWFDVPGMRVRLGRPVEMLEKAAALMALVERGVPADSVVHLIAPTRPAIETPAGPDV